MVINGKFQVTVRLKPQYEGYVNPPRSAYTTVIQVKQEQRLRDEGRKAFACACESAQVAGLEEDDRQLRMFEQARLTALAKTA